MVVDGFVVGRLLGFVGKLIELLLSGCYIVEDDMFYVLFYMLVVFESKYLEFFVFVGMFGLI